MELLHRKELKEGKAAIRTVFLQWGLSKEQTKQLLGEKALEMCLADKRGVETCFLSLTEWSADFGESQWLFTPELEYFQDKFFTYTLIFNSDAFDFAFNAIKDSLGNPKKKQTLPVQNRMGASFDQIEVVWNTNRTLLYMVKRSPSDLQKGSLTVTYLPISATVPEAPKGKAPF